MDHKIVSEKTGIMMAQFIKLCLVSFILLLISGCLGNVSNLSSDPEHSIYVKTQDNLKTVLVSTPSDVDSIEFCFSSSKCEPQDSNSNFILSSDKDRHVFTLNNSSALNFFSVSGKKSESGSIIKRYLQIKSRSSSNRTPTQGKGGKTGSFEASFSSTGSYATSSKYKVNVPDSYNENTPHGLMIYLHGDNAGDYTNPWIFNQLLPVSKERKLITVSVLSPDGGRQWYSKPRVHAEFLHQLIENELFKKYNIDPNHIYFTGSSGGSQFLTGIFVAEFTSNYGGGAFPTCGGDDIYNGFGVQKNITDSMKQDFKLFFYTQTQDFLYSQVTQAKSTYSSLGLKVSGEYPTFCNGTNRCHCEFKMSDAVEKAFKFFDSNN